MSAEQLREGVYRLAIRFPGIGIGADIAALTLSELEAVYRFLIRLESGG